MQSATGFFYLAVITALTAEFAAKVRFLPAEPMRTAVMIGWPIAEVVAWWAASTRGTDVWRLMPGARDDGGRGGPRGPDRVVGADVEPAIALRGAVISGLALYVGTRVVRLAR